MVSSSKPQRDVGLDIYRTVAFLFVPCVHFFLHTGFYEQPVCGGRMFLMVFLRTAFNMCVPMFMLLTGYLTADREIAVSPRPLFTYYKRLGTLYLSYVFATVLTVLYCCAALHEQFTVKGMLKSILSYEGYGWYVEMYLGFAIMIPFLNLMWKGIVSKSGARCMLALLSLLTVLPSVCNAYDIKTPGALLKPWTANSYAGIVPDWWVFLYPITYYFVGAYLKRFADVKAFKPHRVAPLLALSIFVSGSYNILHSYQRPFVSGVWQEYGGWQNMINSVLMFLLLNSVRYTKMPRFAVRFISYISSLTFTAYICSQITDDFLYRRLNEAIPTVTERIDYFPITVMLSASGALLLSAAVHTVIKLITAPKVRTGRVKNIQR